MLWTVTGGIGSGKSAFAEELARTVGHEGIRLCCSPFPEIDSSPNGIDGLEEGSAFPWTDTEADESFAIKLNAINLESNIFRADRRVILIDSLSGLLRLLYFRFDERRSDADEKIEEAWAEALEAIFAFEGKLIVVTEEVFGGLSMNSRELSYARRLTGANRRLMEASKITYRMTSGMASEVKGYRMNRTKGESNE